MCSKDFLKLCDRLRRHDVFYRGRQASLLGSSTTLDAIAGNFLTHNLNSGAFARRHVAVGSRWWPLTVVQVNWVDTTYYRIQDCQGDAVVPRGFPIVQQKLLLSARTDTAQEILSATELSGRAIVYVPVAMAQEGSCLRNLRC